MDLLPFWLDTEAINVSYLCCVSCDVKPCPYYAFWQTKWRQRMFLTMVVYPIDARCQVSEVESGEECGDEVILSFRSTAVGIPGLVKNFRCHGQEPL